MIANDDLAVFEGFEVPESGNVALEKMLLILGTSFPQFELAFVRTIICEREDSSIKLRDNLLSFWQKASYGLQSDTISSSTFILEMTKWISKHLLDLCHSIFQEIFCNITTEKSKALAAECVKTEQLAPSSSLVYGEIDFFAFVNILDLISPAEGSSFVDLGHGTGKAVVAAALMFSPQFTRIHGIELLTSLYSESVVAVQDYARKISSGKYHKYFVEGHSTCDITLAQGDFLAEEAIHGSYYDWTLAGQ